MNSYLYRIIKKSRILPQKSFLKMHYKHETGKALNLENPIDFSEKIQWLKIYYKPPILTQLVDKYEVRSYVSDRVGERYLNEMYGVYRRPEDINFSALPKKFILKATHGWDMNLVIKNDENLDISRITEITRKWLATNHYYNTGMEWAYKNIKPGLIAENFMVEKGRHAISDYKFYCFNGVPKMVQLDMDRGGNAHSIRYYDLNWERLPFVIKGNTVSEDNIEKPKNFDKMIEIARELSTGFPFVRVDLYNIEGKIVFGEMTFYPGDGRTQLEPERYNRIYGDYIKLPRIPNGEKFISQYSHNRTKQASFHEA